MFKKLKPRKEAEAGMTIIELAISLALIGGLVVLYSSMFNIVGYTRKMGNENVAYHIASKKIEELRATPYASLPASSTFTDTQLSLLPSASADFTITNYSTYNGMKEMVVTVNWNDGRARNIVVRSLIGTGGINE
jgi:hypothetical protein